MEEHLDTAKKLVRYMFFRNKTNPDKLGENRDAVWKLTEGRSERDRQEMMLHKNRSLYCEDKVMTGFLKLVKKYRKKVFLYLDDNTVEKTSDKAEQYFSIQSWLFRHRFKTKDGLLRTSYWYHRYLSTGS